MAGARKKLWKKIESDLASAGVGTKSASSEDGSSVSMRSADELKKLLDMAAAEDADSAGRRKVRFLSTRPPGAY